MSEERFKILLAKAGLDGHDRGVKVIARTLRDAGMEVIYTGLFQTPEMIITAALQEDVDAICLSILSGAHMTLFTRVRELMNESGLEHVLLSGGGIIPPDDATELSKLGVGRLFGPGSPMEEIVTYFRAELPQWRTRRLAN
jgi:methylmalonyl-CoA mutase C-terminal domain/subunit